MRSLLASLLALAVGCSASAAPPAAPLEPPEDPGRPTTLNLEDADSLEVLSVTQIMLQEPVLVDVSALAALRCVKITIKEPQPVPRRQGGLKLLDKLRERGFRATRGPSGWVVAVDDARPAPPCAPEGRATAASEAAATPRAATPGTAPGPAVDEEAVTAEIVRSIREISPTEHAVTAHGLDLFLQNQGVLSRTARIAPDPSGAGGIRVYGVRPDGILGRLGFRNGDRVERVMGKSVATPESALEAYASMRNAPVIPVEIERGGAKVKLVIRVE